ncbi:MAG: 30S ribosomal protein S8 [Candidatus Omnitrophica bacterium]|nr:30S ribosomal protein S8 [Candidatus Omnitrophota bacterium]
MSRTDLIADCFTVIRNAARSKKEDAYIPYSGPMLAICDILKREGYLENYKEVDLEKKKKIRVYLKYLGKKSSIIQIKRVSRPGRRVYVGSSSIPSALDGYGLTILSTSTGIISGRQAREKGIGGEVIGMVW